MEANDISESRFVVASYDGFLTEHGLNTTFYQQILGPDGRIYMTSTNGSRYLHIIRNPENLGFDCNVLQHSITLPTVHAWAVPNFPNYRLGPVDGSICDTLGIDNHVTAFWRYDHIGSSKAVSFTDLSYFEPTEWEWSFGDGETSEDKSPTHEYNFPGSYNVCLTVRNQFSMDTHCKSIDIVFTLNESVPGSDGIIIAPNPFTGVTNIHIPIGLSLDCLTIYEISGRIVHKFNNPDSGLLDLTDLSDGVYVYTAAIKGKIVQTGRMIMAR
jgi:hypothetical protein